MSIVPLFQVCEIIESPLFLKLNPMTKHTDVSNPDPMPICYAFLSCLPLILIPLLLYDISTELNLHSSTY